MSFQNGLHKIAKFVIRFSGSLIHPLYKIQTYSSSSLVLDLLIRAESCWFPYTEYVPRSSFLNIFCFLVYSTHSTQAQLALFVVVLVTTSIAATAIAETTGIADQNPLTTQFYLLLAESPL